MTDPELELEQPQADAPEAEAEVSDDDLLSAINEELEGVGDEPEPEPETKAESDAEPEPAPDVPEPDAVQADSEADGEPAAADEPPAEAAAEATAEPAAEVEPEPPAADAKPSDEFGELEKDVPEKTRERFDTLKHRYDEIVAERDAVKTESDQWRDSVLATGTNPQQFGTMLTYLGKINSKRPEDLNDAYDMMSRELSELGKALGKPVNGSYDPLSENPDLKEKVSEGLLDEESAHEIAQARASQRLSAASQQHAEQQTQQQASIQRAKEEVGALGAELAKTDPNFQAKVPVLMPFIESLVESGVPPEKWASSIRNAAAKIPVQAAPKPPPPKPTAPNPIRPTGASPANATMQSEPGSEMEAINQALDQGF